MRAASRAVALEEGRGTLKFEIQTTASKHRRVYDCEANIHSTFNIR